jgi:hypothetical protein
VTLSSLNFRVAPVAVSSLGKGLGSVAGSGCDIGKIKRDLITASVLNSEVGRLHEVCRIVEGEAGNAQDRFGIRSIIGLEQPAALLGHRSKVRISGGSVVEEIGIGRGRQDVFELHWVKRATNFGNKRGDGSCKRARHRGTRENSIAAKRARVGR